VGGAVKSVECAYALALIVDIWAADHAGATERRINPYRDLSRGPVGLREAEAIGTGVERGNRGGKSGTPPPDDTVSPEPYATPGSPPFRGN
jgi:hypothetical protein